MKRLEADVDRRNTAAARSLEKLSFMREGHLLELWIVDEEVSDSAFVFYWRLSGDGNRCHITRHGDG